LSFLDHSNICVEIYQYQLSYLELFAVISGIIAVGLAALAKRINFLVGMLNAVLYGFLFYQIQLYADMLLQGYYFIMSILGFIFWQEDSIKDNYKTLSISARTKLVFIILTGSAIFAIFIANLHCILPQFFSQKASYPWVDAFITFTSVVAMYLLTKKYLENWYLWIVVNVVAIALYAIKGVIFTSILYFIFLIIAIQAIYFWNKKK